MPEVYMKSAKLGEPIRYPKSHGDTWTAAWADDDNIYMTTGDCQGFDQGCSSNIGFHRLSGAMPPDLKGETINPMTEYGGWGEHLKEDDCMWKASGLISVDGVLYMSVSRHTLPWDHCDIQRAWDASIVKSEDKGKTWSQCPGIGKSMFPGMRFSNPTFIDYGKDGAETFAHGADKYIYAYSNDGTWSHGNSMCMGRVARDKIGNLDARDWEFIVHHNKNKEPVWGQRHDIASHLLYEPGKLGQCTGITYLPKIDKYILASAHFLPMEGATFKERFRRCKMEFYQARKPWGRWWRFYEKEYPQEGWYSPRIPSKFISEDGLKMWVFVSGDWTTAKTLDGYYGLHMIPMNVEVGE